MTSVYNQVTNIFSKLSKIECRLDNIENTIVNGNGERIWDTVFKEHKEKVSSIISAGSVATAFCVTPGGHLLTCAHSLNLIDDNADYLVLVENYDNAGTTGTIKYRLLGLNPEYDLAILIPAIGEPLVTPRKYFEVIDPVETSGIGIGTEVAVIGFELGLDHNSYSTGVIREVKYVIDNLRGIPEQLMKTVPGAFGTSGSPVITNEGKVVGIHSWTNLGVTSNYIEIIESYTGGTNGFFIKQFLDYFYDFTTNELTENIGFFRPLLFKGQIEEWNLSGYDNGNFPPEVEGYRCTFPDQNGEENSNEDSDEDCNEGPIENGDVIIKVNGVKVGPLDNQSSLIREFAKSSGPINYTIKRKHIDGSWDECNDRINMSSFNIRYPQPFVINLSNKFFNCSCQIKGKLLNLNKEKGNGFSGCIACIKNQE